ncbi:MAG TPA: hypothetical protein VIG47_17470, partial [Gemmatimonadaceae bacterium]
MLSDRTVSGARVSRTGPSHGAREMALTTWECIRAEPAASAHPAELRDAQGAWLPATAPGTVAAALAQAGKWSWSDPLAIDDYDWWYRCSFVCDDHEAGGTLLFGGLASLADVWLNGVHVLTSDNMFVSHSVDTGSALRRENEIVIRFASVARALTARRPRPRWRTRLVSSQNLRWIRTTLLGRIPGWSSAAQPVGPWKAVSLVPRSTVRVLSRKVRSRLDGDDGVVSLAIRVSVPAGVHFSAASVKIGAVERTAIVRQTGEDIVVHATIRIADAALWWPHTHGKQPLYDASLTLRSNDTEAHFSVGKVAFRTIALDTKDGNFAVSVNGTEVFWRGVCWSPADPLQVHASAADYRRALELARDAGMNMVRVGGTMVYEHDHFYDLCDELGIVIWQDLMFANMDYPASDAAFIASAEIEVGQALQRIGGRPSLALICGNSEIEQQASMLGLPKSEWRSSLFSERFADLAAEHAPGVPYWPSSPSGGTLPFHVNAGDGHYFGYGPYLRPLSDVRASEVRFASESLALSNLPEPAFIDRLPCGPEGAGHHPDWKRGVPRDSGAGWDFEDVRDHYVREMFGVDPVAQRYGDPERYLALGRVAGGEVMSRTIAEWRRADSPCNGALVWLYRDLRPGAGWGVLDFEGNPKAAYYYLARAFEPVTIVMSDEGLNGVMVHAINDGSEPRLVDIRLSLYRGEVNVGGALKVVELTSRGNMKVAADEMLGEFADVSY